ncbi:thioredoxin family protein [Methylicorpusculum sp.]|uniref:thioredoxin family protein n=1 Tax=Methylicorpusculum sp. TaxID=2713644 RepID=UPI002AB94342|nr:thioredoxin family protein [Methylicorpusculum sp.]MDZ4151206.1 thioredoxin family protein [Methylicorpusculum sp.]
MIKLFRTLVFLLFAGSAVAGEQPFTQKAFEQQQKEGKPTLVSVHADWCPTCRAQAPIVKSLLEQPPYNQINALRVDFDQQKDVVKSFRVLKQSTLIVFKNGQEVGRSLGDTNPEAIETLLKKAL